MSDHESPRHGSDRPLRTTFVDLLDHGDGFAHLLVAVILLLLALGVLVNSTIGFIHELHDTAGTAKFAVSGLKYLSDILLGVIILELLSTILSYVRARQLEATIKDFLVVGLISSVRKILLIGAQSSLEIATGDEFVKESIGTVISIIGILLLIGGLMLLDMRRKRIVASEQDQTTKLG